MIEYTSKRFSLNPNSQEGLLETSKETPCTIHLNLLNTYQHLKEGKTLINKLYSKSRHFILSLSMMNIFEIAHYPSQENQFGHLFANIALDDLSNENHSLTVKTCFAYSLGFILYTYSR